MLWNHSGHLTALDCMKVPTCEPTADGAPQLAPHKPLALAETVRG
jgi:hypothetical protein